MVHRLLAMASPLFTQWCDYISYGGVGVLVLFLSFAVMAMGAISWYMILLKKERSLLPPGPPCMPILGNLPFLHPDLHTCFAKLAQKYGPIMRLWLGYKLTVVLSSPSIVKEALRDNDAIFADRDTPTAMLTMTYGGSGLISARCDQNWRMLRRVCAEEMLGKVSLDRLYYLRRREVSESMRRIYANAGREVDVNEHAFLAMINVITSMLWGRTLKHEERRVAEKEFRQVVWELFDLLTTPDVSDLFPVLAPLDIQGKNSKMKKLLSRLDKIFDFIIDHHEVKGVPSMEGIENEDGGHRDLLQIFLRNEEGSKGTLEKSQIKALFLDMIAAGTDTASSTVEWAMAELMNKPEKMERAQKEIELVVGRDNMVEETHLPDLHFLNAITKEVLRLHPPGPFLVPRRTRHDCVLRGYTIPSGTQLLVNAWAIHRDPEFWDSPSEFQPERFLTAGSLKCDYSGNDFRYLPYGSGRRMCAGVALAERMAPHILASMLHLFDWKLPDGVNEVDLAEKFGLVLRKATPFIAVPNPRLWNLDLYV